MIRTKKMHRKTQNWKKRSIFGQNMTRWKTIYFLSTELAEFILDALIPFLSRAKRVRKGFTKKSSCSFGFCPNYLDPPSPNLDNLYHFFWTPMCQKIWAGVSPSLPIPKLTEYIQFVKSGQKIWAGPSPPHLDKIQKNSYFPSMDFVPVSVVVFNHK